MTTGLATTTSLEDETVHKLDAATRLDTYEERIHEFEAVTKLDAHSSQEDEERIHEWDALTRLTANTSLGIDEIIQNLERENDKVLRNISEKNRNLKVIDSIRIK